MLIKITTASGNSNLLNSGQAAHMDIRDIRRRRLKQLIAQKKSDGEVKNNADFARRHQIDTSYLSQILNGHRKIGEQAARKLEGQIGLSHGHLDGDDPIAGLSVHEREALYLIRLAPEDYRDRLLGVMEGKIDEWSARSAKTPTSKSVEGGGKQ